MYFVKQIRREDYPAHAEPTYFDVLPAETIDFREGLDPPLRSCDIRMEKREGFCEPSRLPFYHGGLC